MKIEALGHIALDRGDYQEAVNIFRRAIDEKPGADGWAGLARAYAELEEWLTARWAVYKALDLEAKHADAQALARLLEERMSRPVKKYPAKRQALYRTGKNRIERSTPKGWQPFFVKGINLGLAAPGTYPGEYSLGKTQFRRWFKQMMAGGFNAVRVYTIQSPSFYEALAEVNDRQNTLALIQGVWIEPPEDSHFSSDVFLQYTRRQIAEAVDALFGNLSLPERPGYPHGTYACDVSPLTLGIIFGREWESCPVRKYNRLSGGALRDYDGSFLSAAGVTPFEGWICRMLDEIQVYGQERYGVAHLVSTVCWPTLDPLTHPSESNYEDGLRLQGLGVKPIDCNENEDMETLDTAKFAVKKGNGFFATYHAYPYYPDFMNNDYLDRDKPYSAYLAELKAHHRQQPIVIAEYGVPSSREVSHWQRQGWHHGGHDEGEQGRINGEMLQAISETGLAGGALFAWFDEWFKRNWLFMNYELPADRNALWFNSQDAEQCYGLIGAYPGYPKKIVTLAGDASEWRDSTVLYRNDDELEHRFDDGADAARRLVSLKVQHDEGFLYLALATGGPVDFRLGHYVIGIDTCDPSAGEFSLPFNLGVTSPVGLKYLIHLTGEKTSRMLVCATYDKYLNDPYGDLWPKPSREGTWVQMFNKTNDRRLSKDGTHFYPARIFPVSPLRHGTLDTGNRNYNALADFHVSGSLLELRIPWGVLMVTDPSSQTVYWKQGNKLTRQTDGLRFVVFSYKPSGNGYLAAKTGRSGNDADRMPRVMESRIIRPYAWTGWNVPLFHFYEKKSLAVYSRYLKEIR